MRHRFSLLIQFLVLLLFVNNVFSQKSDYVTLSGYQDRESYSAGDTVKLALSIDIKQGYHINSYKVNDPTLIKTEVSTESGDFKLINAYFPADKKLKFEFSENEIDVYEGNINVGLKLITSASLLPGKFEIPVLIKYQACDDKVCYPPKDVTLTIPVTLSQSAGKLINPEHFKGIDFNSPVSKEAADSKTSLKENERTVSPTNSEDEVSNIIEEKGWLAAVLVIFLGGLALNLTPCVYPLIPITISFFGAQSSGSKLQSILMGIFYALGMSVTYSALGVFAALTGSLLGTALQNPLVIIVIALIMFALGTSMFGLFEIRVPQSLALAGNKNRSGYFGSVLMGLTVGFIAAPCIGPFVLSLLVFVGKLGNPVTGFLLFFVLSMGLGLPYVFLSASSSSLSKLPRSGEWMEGVKIVFGLILFGMALKTLSPLISNEIFKVIFPLYIIAAGAYLILIDRKGHTSVIYSKIKYFIAIFAIVMGTWMLKPAESAGEVQWKVMTSLESIEKSMASENKPVMIDFYADWCAQCKELDEYTYTNPDVIELSKSFNTIKVDLTKENEDITRRFNIKGLPVVAFMNSKGEEFADQRVTGFLKPEEFQKKMISVQKNLSSK